MDVWLSVLGALLERPDDYKRGLVLSRAARVPADALYFNLLRLERCGWVESAWDHDSSAAVAHRPLRRHYRLTALGKLEAVRVVTNRATVADEQLLEIAAWF